MLDDDRADVIKGYLLVAVGVIILSPDALIIRLADLHEAQFAFWRGIFGGVVILALVIRSGGLAALTHSLFRTGFYGPALVVINLIGSSLFVVAVSNTAVSNVLILLACSPVFSALIGRFVLNERLPWQTWLTIFICLGGILTILGQDFLSERKIGAMAALGVALALAISSVLLRFTRQYNMAACVGVGYLFVPVAIAAWFAINQSPIQPLLHIDSEDLMYLIANGFVTGISFYMIANAPRYISAPEVGLVMLLESLLGSLLVWVAINEVPANSTIISGSIVLITLTIHGYWRINRKPVISPGAKY